MGPHKLLDRRKAKCPREDKPTETNKLQRVDASVVENVVEKGVPVVMGD